MNKIPKIAKSPIKTHYGDFEMFVFSWSENEQDNVLVLRTHNIPEVPLVRVQSACYTGEIFKSLDCDCHWQLSNGLKKIQEHGGYFIYMLCDGRGAGLLTKVRGLALSSDENIDTADAYEQLGVPLDPRKYEQPVYVLKEFGVEKVKLLTNNPRKVDGLTAGGLVVERLAHESDPTKENCSYLKAKATKLGHFLTSFED